MAREFGGVDYLSFRKDLSYHRIAEGFELHAVNAHYTVRGFTGAGHLGDLIHEGKKTIVEIQNTLARAGYDIFSTIGILQKLFDCGLLNEDIERDDIGSAAKVTGLGSGLVQVEAR